MSEFAFLFKGQRSQTKQCGACFSENKSVNRDGDGDFPALNNGGVAQKPYGKNADKLFCKIGKCGQKRFLLTVIISNNTSVDRGERNGKRHDAQQRRTAFLRKDVDGEEICLCVKDKKYKD